MLTINYSLLTINYQLIPSAEEQVVNEGAHVADGHLGVFVTVGNRQVDARFISKQ